MRRRACLKLALVPTVMLVATGHTPYRQWAVYRRKHLLILTDKEQAGSFERGQQLAVVLASNLPASKARVTRAPYRERMASLIISQQLDLALFKREEALALLHGQEPFADYGPLRSLRLLIVSDDFVLVCRDDFPAQHAYLVSKTLVEFSEPELAVLPGTQDENYPPLHKGVLAYMKGEPMPQAEDTVEESHRH